MAFFFETKNGEKKPWTLTIKIGFNVRIEATNQRELFSCCFSLLPLMRIISNTHECRLLNIPHGTTNDFKYFKYFNCSYVFDNFFVILLSFSSERDRRNRFNVTDMIWNCCFWVNIQHWKCCDRLIPGRVVIHPGIVAHNPLLRLSALRMIELSKTFGTWNFVTFTIIE